MSSKSWMLMTMVIAVLRMATLPDPQNGAVCIPERQLPQVSPPTMKFLEAFPNSSALRAQLTWMAYILSRRELYHTLQIKAKLLNILGTATQGYPWRTSAMCLISLAY